MSGQGPDSPECIRTLPTPTEGPIASGLSGDVTMAESAWQRAVRADRRTWWRRFESIRPASTGPTKRQAAGPRFRQTSAGLYVPAPSDEAVVEQRIFEQAHRIRS